MAEDIVDQLDDIGDQWERLLTRMKVSMAPALTDTATGMERFAQSLRAVTAFIGGFLSSLGGTSGSQRIGFLNLANGSALLKLKEALNDAAGAFTAEQELIAEQVVGSERVQARKKAARRERERSGPGFIPGITAATKLGGSPYSDALTGVGNFLGSGLSSSLASVGERTNQLIAKSNQLLENIRDKIDVGGLDLGVP